MASEVTVKVLTYNVFLRDEGGFTKLVDFARFLRLTNFNLKFFNVVRAKLIGNLLVNSDYDVLVFEEAFDNEAREEMVKILKKTFTHQTEVVGRVDTASKNTSDGGVFIMSRWQIISQDQIVYRATTGDDSYAKKGVLWALIKKQHLYFNVFATHTQADASPKTFPEIRQSQFKELRGLIDKIRLYWQPALIAGDLNIDNAATKERNDMLVTLQAELTQNRSKHTPTSDPGNDIKDDKDPATTLDYVLWSRTHQAPIHSSLETIKLRSEYFSLRFADILGGTTPRKYYDLSDHYAVLGTFTFPDKDESTRFNGTWKSVLFNGQSDTRDWHLTFDLLGDPVTSIINGTTYKAYIHQLIPGKENRGKIIFFNQTVNKLEEFDYSFSTNRSFEDYFIPGETRLESEPPSINELMLSRPGRTTHFAFESWLPKEPIRLPDRTL